MREVIVHTVTARTVRLPDAPKYYALKIVNADAYEQGVMLVLNSKQGVIEVGKAFQRYEKRRVAVLRRGGDPLPVYMGNNATEIFEAFIRGEYPTVNAIKNLLDIQKQLRDLTTGGKVFVFELNRVDKDPDPSWTWVEIDGGLPGVKAWIRENTVEASE